MQDFSGTFTGSASGSTVIELVGELSPGYTEIKPIVTNTVDWNGDDDGSEYVSGSISLVDEAGNVLHTNVFDDVLVDLSRPPTGCTGETCLPES
jgi:hypothetical protein